MRWEGRGTLHVEQRGMCLTARSERKHDESGNTMCTAEQSCIAQERATIQDVDRCSMFFGRTMRVMRAGSPIQSCIASVVFN